MTTSEKLARLNELRAATGKPVIAKWKDSVAKLDAAIAKIESEYQSGPAPQPVAVKQPEPTKVEEPKLSCKLLYYRIPTAVSRGTDEVDGYPNPSNRLRRFGFRVDGSVWVIPENAWPHALVTEMREAGATVGDVKFDMAEGPALVRMAVEQMKKDVEEQLARTRISLANAEEKYLEGAIDTEGGREEAVKRFEVRARWMIRNLRKLAEDVEVAIKNFGAAPELLGLTDARTAFTALQHGYEVRSAAYVRAAKELAAVGTVDATALANAAQKDLVPAAVLQGALEDAGKEVAATALHDAFDDSAKPVSNEGTFSLV